MVVWTGVLICGVFIHAALVAEFGNSASVLKFRVSGDLNDIRSAVDEQRRGGYGCGQRSDGHVKPR